MNAPAIVLAQIWVYPIKSLGGVRMPRAAVTAAGSLALDREWVVIDRNDHKLWQGDLPRMALTRCGLEAQDITVSFPGMETLRLARHHAGPPRTITMYGQRFAAVDAGDEAAGWLSEALRDTVRLVRIGDAAHRWPGLNPVHVLSTASLAALNSALLARGEVAVEIERFRPSLVLDSPGDTLPAFFEERFEAIRLGDTELEFLAPCIRCALPNISRRDASRGRQPLKLIGALSRERSSAAPAAFGTYARLARATTLAEGAAGIPLRVRDVPAVPA